MIVIHHEAKFNELAKFAPKLVEDEGTRVHKFQMGLRAEIRKGVAPLQLTTYADMMNTVLIVEREIEQE